MVTIQRRWKKLIFETIDSGGDVEIIIELDGWDESFYINKDEAISIIKHLKEQFEL